MLRPVTALDFFLNFILITTLRVTFHLQKLQSIHYIPCVVWASQVVLEVKNPPANAGDLRGVGSLPGSGRSCGGGHGNPLQYSCMENPVGRGAWRATVHGITQSQS